MMKTASVEFGFEIEPKSQTTPLIKQVHGRDLAWQEELKAVPDADAILTRAAGNPIFVFSADCLPVLLYTDNPSDPIAAIHAGWRGAMRGVVSHTLQEMVRKSQESVRAVLGPCLRHCCFEVKDDFIQEFQTARGDLSPYLRDNHFDLVKFVCEKELGVIGPSYIQQEFSLCTYCSTPLLPSYRRNKGTDPRIRSWITKR